MSFSRRSRTDEENANAQKARKAAEIACRELKEEEIRLNRMGEVYNRRLANIRPKDLEQLEQEARRHNEEDQTLEATWQQKLDKVPQENEALRQEMETLRQHNEVQQKEKEVLRQ